MPQVSKESKQRAAFLDDKREVVTQRGVKAAGVIGARHVGFQCGFKNLITFDMGGTTAKASIIEDGQLCLFWFARQD